MIILPASQQRRAFSLPEILMVMAVIGVLTAMAIPAYTGITSKAQDAEAGDFVESLNRAVLRYSQANWDMPTAADNSATTDEFVVLRSLQYAWPKSALKPGSPYFPATYNPSASTDSSQYRVRWNGRTFELLKPATSGSGLLKTFSGADYTAASYVFPSGYMPAGMR